LAPTRELAKQICSVVTGIGTYLNVRAYLAMGGTHLTEDKKAISSGVHIVVGTPGRICDLMKKEILSATYFKVVVMDEADEMLGRGF